ncbi:MAG TPA: vitamin K epoxide reductase family protein [Acidimicrobiales bacterium]|nr:vitamin K epoxide reductase family protein [Acidimicrobiales bacterium]
MSRWRPIAATIVSLLGLAIATYLTYSHYTAGAKGVNICPFGRGSSGTIDCQAVLTSGWSTILGLPVALYGAVFFLFMLVIDLPVMWRSESLRLAQLRLAAACAGMAMVVYLVAVELLAVHHICIWCTSVHILQFILFMLVITGWNDTGWAASKWVDVDEDLELRPRAGRS